MVCSSKGRMKSVTSHSPIVAGWPIVCRALTENAVLSRQVGYRAVKFVTEEAGGGRPLPLRLEVLVRRKRTW